MSHRPVFFIIDDLHIFSLIFTHDNIYYQATKRDINIISLFFNVML